MTTDKILHFPDDENERSEYRSPLSNSEPEEGRPEEETDVICYDCGTVTSNQDLDVYGVCPQCLSNNTSELI